MDLHFVKLHGYLTMYINLASTPCSSSISNVIESRGFAGRHTFKGPVAP